MRHRDAEWYEREYNPRVLVPEVDEIIDSWNTRAQATRERYEVIENVSYGPHPRELIDLFRAPNSRGTVYFIHGGNWTRFSKHETSWIADAFLEQGLSVALLNYPLCPEVTLPAIIASTTRAFAHLYREVLNDDECEAITVVGYSAGAYLAAAHLTTDWTHLRLPARPITGVMAISGLYDLRPVVHTAANAQIKLNDPIAAALSLTNQPVVCPVPLVLAVGDRESGEFQRQSKTLASHWLSTLDQPLQFLRNRNHFTVLEDLLPGGSLAQTVTRLTRQSVAA